MVGKFRFTIYCTTDEKSRDHDKHPKTTLKVIPVVMKLTQLLGHQRNYLLYHAFY